MDVVRLFHTLLPRTGLVNVELKVGCHLAAKDHQASPRTFAHTWHLDGVVCVDPSINSIPDAFKTGILLHEMGHLFAGPDGSEEDADNMVEAVMDIRIDYRDISETMKNVQYVPLDKLFHEVKPICCVHQKDVKRTLEYLKTKPTRKDTER